MIKPYSNLAKGSALAALFLCLGAGAFFGDFRVAGNVFRFVPWMLLASAAFFFSVGQASARNFWWVAIGLRLLVLPMAPGDDVWRYLWEGQMQWHGFDPYRLAPDAVELTSLRGEIWEQVGHRGYAAIYPPGAELLFKLLTIGGGSVWLLKLAFVAADLGVVSLLLRLQPDHRDVAWYAWCPLVVYAFAGAAHYDSVMLLALMLAVFYLWRATQQNGSWRPAALAALFLGVTISIKLVPLVLLPVFALALRRRFVLLLLSAVVPMLTSLPFGFPPTPFLTNVREFGNVTRFNDLIWWISERLVWANPTQKNGFYVVVSMILVSAISLVFWRDWRRNLLWTLGAALILSTVLHPWYLTWILPFAAMQRARGWFVLAATIFVAFLWWETTPFWQAWMPSPLLSLAISLPPLGWLVFQKWRESLQRTIDLR